MSHAYETIEGTKSNTDEQHEPRTVKHTLPPDESGEVRVHMMTEIGDGTFVAWDRCRQCSKAIKDCKCPGGPVEAEFMQVWRDKRFTKSFDRRSVDPALPASLGARDRRIAAVMRFLLARGYTIEAPLTERLKAAKPADAEALAIDDLTDKEGTDFIEAIEPAREETATQVDDGLDAALEKVRNAKEGTYDAGF